jgi:hypothetical protein
MCDSHAVDGAVTDVEEFADGAARYDAAHAVPHKTDCRQSRAIVRVCVDYSADLGSNALADLIDALHRACAAVALAAVHDAPRHTAQLVAGGIQLAGQAIQPVTEDEEVVRLRSVYPSLQVKVLSPALLTISTGMGKEEGDAVVLAAVAAQQHLLSQSVAVEPAGKVRAQAPMRVRTLPAQLTYRARLVREIRPVAVAPGPVHARAADLAATIAAAALSLERDPAAPAFGNPGRGRFSHCQQHCTREKPSG